MRRLLILEAGGADRPPLWPRVRSLALALAKHGFCEGGSRDLSATANVSGRAVEAVRHLVRGRTSPNARPIVLLFGSIARQRRVMWALAAAGLRPRVLVVLHVPAAHVPFEPAASDLFGLADAIVTESAFGERAVTQACLQANSPLRRPVHVIPPLVDWEDPDVEALTDRPPASAAVPPTLVVGCCVGDDKDRRGFLATQIFRAFVQGLYWECADCGRATAFDVDDALTPIETTTCRHCHSRRGRRARLFADARLLFVLGASAAGRPTFRPHQWTLLEFADACGLRSRVSMRGGPGSPSAVSRASLIDTLRTLDLHLLPHDGPDIETSVIAGCALGVPTITTRFGAAADTLEPFAQLVPPSVYTWSSEGHVVALMDVGRGIDALRSLAGSREARITLGQAARHGMRQQHPAIVAAHWRDHLNGLWSEGTGT